MPESRAARRKVRYDYAIKLGFSVKAARRFRDLSGRHIERLAKQERRRISRKTIARRTPDEQFRIDAITRSFNETTVAARERRFMSKAERVENYSSWSGTDFPDWALERIQSYNRQRNLNRFDSFGYRRFYYWYVERFADFENEFYADRGDSELRHEQNLPLRSRAKLARNAAA